jgi:hypothetical protein
LEYYTPIGDSASFTLSPFARIDEHDSERSHADLREALWHHWNDKFEIRAGVGKVFWGVTESRHLVDIINQTDGVEGLDGEDKLGQPMVQLTIPHDWGNLEFFWLPYFRERTFAGVDGRPRAELLIDADNPVYEAGDEQKHWDFAVRWGHYFGDWDVSLSHFSGTARDPRLVPTFSNGAVVLVPHYDLIDRTGVAVQATIEEWLWKLEAIYQSAALREDHGEAVAGVEYSFFDLAESGADLGMIAEYLYDDRGDDADQPFQNDLMLGLRLALNDEQSSEALIGVIQDLDGGGRSLRVEASRRLGASFKLSLEAQWIEDVDRADDPLLATLAKEDSAQLQLAWFF